MAVAPNSGTQEEPLPRIPAPDLGDRIHTEERLLVLYGTTACPHTRRFRPTFDSFAEQTTTPCVFGDLTGIPPNEWASYDVELTPTVIAYAQGEAVGQLAPEPHTDLAADAFQAFAGKYTDTDEAASSHA